MKSFFVLCLSVLVIFACKESKKSTDIMYTSVCGEFWGTDTVLVLIGDSSIIVPGLFGPDTMSIKGPDGSTLTQVKFGPVYDQKISEGDTLEYGGNIIDFSNRDAVIGYVILGKMQKDTLINLNPETKKEEISVVESLKTDTISTCTFTKGGGK